MLSKKRIQLVSFFVLILSIIFFRFFLNISIINVLLFSIIIFIIIGLYLIYKFLSKLKRAGYSEKWHKLYGESFLNLPYYKDNKIKNSFKKGGINYIEEIGEINGGKL